MAWFLDFRRVGMEPESNMTTQDVAALLIKHHPKLRESLHKWIKEIHALDPDSAQAAIRSVAHVMRMAEDDDATKDVVVAATAGMPADATALLVHISGQMAHVLGVDPDTQRKEIASSGHHVAGLAAWYAINAKRLGDQGNALYVDLVQHLDAEDVAVIAAMGVACFIACGIEPDDLIAWLD